MIHVEDNGPGMEPEALAKIMHYIEQSQEWERMPDLKIRHGTGEYMGPI